MGYYGNRVVFCAVQDLNFTFLYVAEETLIREK